MNKKDEEHLKEIFSRPNEGKNVFDYPEEFSKKLLNSGWTMVPTLPIFTANTIFNSEDKDVDFLISIFLKEKKQFNSMIENIMESKIDKLKGVVNEALYAYNSGRYKVCGIALMAVIEGGLSQFLDNKNSTNIKRICEIEAGKHKNEKNMKCVFWISCNDFIKRVFDNRSFNENEPDFLNRHWLLHGRSKYQVNEVDCMKLFNAISCICLLIRHYLDK